MIYSLKNAYLTVQFTSFGGEISSVKNKDNHEYMHVRDEVWQRTNPVLFPFCGLQKDDCFIYEDKTYKGLRHGFARDCEFVREQVNQDSITFSLTYDDKLLKKYPFKFKLSIIYKLLKNELFIDYQVENLDDKTMYFGVGAHPGFNIKYKDNKMSDYYYLFNEYEEAYELKGTKGLTNGKKELTFKGHKLLIDEHLFDHDSKMFKGLNSNMVSLVSDKSPYRIDVTFPKNSYLLVWAPRGLQDFVCIEPWQTPNGFTDDNHLLKDMKDIVALEKQSVFHYKYSIKYHE